MGCEFIGGDKKEGKISGNKRKKEKLIIIKKKVRYQWRESALLKFIKKKRN